MALHPDAGMARRGCAVSGKAVLPPLAAPLDRPKRRRQKKDLTMSSILTNTSAMVALQTMKSINSSLNKTQAEISTGKSVNTAKDNATVWMTLAFDA